MILLLLYSWGLFSHTKFSILEL